MAADTKSGRCTLYISGVAMAWQMNRAIRGKASCPGPAFPRSETDSW